MKERFIAISLLLRLLALGVCLILPAIGSA